MSDGCEKYANCEKCPNLIEKLLKNFKAAIYFKPKLLLKMIVL